MNENHVAVNSGKAFLLAARPMTLSGAAVPVMIGVALAIHDMGWERFVTPVAGDWYASRAGTPVFPLCDGDAGGCQLCERLFRLRPREG